MVMCHRNTLQHPATHCNTLQHPATYCNTRQHTATQEHRVVEAIIDFAEWWCVKARTLAISLNKDSGLRWKFEM